MAFAKLAPALWMLAALSALGGPPAMAEPSADAQLAVVCAPGCPFSPLTKDDVESAWSGRRPQDSMRGAELWDLPDGNGVQAAFVSKALGKDTAQYRALWAKVVFNGKGRPPKVAQDEESLAKALAASPTAIGYMAKSSAEARGLKILATY